MPQAHLLSAISYLQVAGQGTLISGKGSLFADIGSMLEPEENIDSQQKALSNRHVLSKSNTSRLQSPVSVDGDDVDC